MKTLHVTNRVEWRAWLDKNNRTEGEVWLVYHKKHTGRPRIPYDDAVEEALCFGWIDSIVKRIDEEKYMQRFTPRRKNSVWSESNKRRALAMIRKRRMTETGMAKVREAKENGKWRSAGSPRGTPPMPSDLKKALAANKKAKEKFEDLAPSHKKQYIGRNKSAGKNGTCYSQQRRPHRSKRKSRPRSPFGKRIDGRSATA